MTEHHEKKSVYPEHFVTWGISFASFSGVMALIWAVVKFIYLISVWSNSMTMQIDMLQKSITSIESRLAAIENNQCQIVKK